MLTGRVCRCESNLNAPGVRMFSIRTVRKSAFGLGYLWVKMGDDY